jgi:hypothetical protein
VSNALEQQRNAAKFQNKEESFNHFWLIQRSASEDDVNMQAGLSASRCRLHVIRGVGLAGAAE